MSGRFEKVFAKLAQDAGLSAVAAGGSAVLGMVRAGILSRSVGLDGFGRIALAMSTFVLVRQLLSVRVWEWVATLVAGARTRDDGSLVRGALLAAYGIGIAIGAVAFVLVVAIALPLSRFLLDDGSLAPLLRLASLQALVLWMDEPSLALLRVSGRYRWIAAYNLGGSAFRTAAVAACSLVARDVDSLLGVQVAAQFVLSALLLVRVRFELSETVGRARDGIARLWAERSMHARTLVTLSATDTVKAVTSELDPTLITYFTGTPEAAGAYRAAHAIVNGLLQLLTPLYFVVHAEIVNGVARRDVRFVRDLAVRFSAAITAFVVIVGAFVGGLAPQLVTALFGAGFDATVPCVRTMLFGLAMPAVGWANPLCVAIGRPAWFFRVVVVMAVTKLVGLAVLAPRFGAVGASASFALSNLSAVVSSLVLLPAMRARLEELRTGSG